MSHYSVVKTKILSKEALKKALCCMGFQEHMIEIFDTPQNLRGYRGDTREQKAHVRIKGSGWSRSENYVGEASNDLGWEFHKDGTTTFHVSEYDRRKYSQCWQDKLMVNYTKEVTLGTVDDMGWTLEDQEVDVEGNLVLTINTGWQ